MAKTALPNGSTTKLNGKANGEAHRPPPPTDPASYPVLDVLGPAPPLVPRTPAYTPAKALEDLPGVRYALSLFLASFMIETEDYLTANDPDKERMYFTSGHALIETTKALMSYEDAELLSAIAQTNHSAAIAQTHRKKPSSVWGKVASYVTAGSSVAFLQSMTPMERHAELVYAETSIEKAFLGVMFSGDWFAFVKEALAMRSAIAIYRSLHKFITTSDAASSTGKDMSIDEDFRSGVALGMGSTSLVLSLLPGKVLSVIELFGYTGDRKFALENLISAGGWDKMEGSEPAIGIQEEGLRRPLCDLTLLVFHLVASSLTFDGIDIPFASRVLAWNLLRFPNGVFLLFGSGRLFLQTSLPAQSIEAYTKALKCQDQYPNLHYICYWEMAMAHLCLWELEKSLENWEVLMERATWSRCVYTYGVACCLLELGGVENAIRAEELMGKVAGLSQRIAGKSIPIEKFATRKSKKYGTTKRLVLPLLELGYFFTCFAQSDLQTVLTKFLPAIEQTLQKVEEWRKDVKGYEEEKGGYWDEYLVLRFLEGVSWRFVAYASPDANPDSRILRDGATCPPAAEAAANGEKALSEVLKNSSKVMQDHYILYHAHYELGRLLANMGDEKEARAHLGIVLSGKSLEDKKNPRKGKYSGENVLIMRTTAAVDALDSGRKV